MRVGIASARDLHASPAKRSALDVDGAVKTGLIFQQEGRTLQRVTRHQTHAHGGHRTDLAICLRGQLGDQLLFEGSVGFQLLPKAFRLGIGQQRRGEVGGLCGSRRSQ
jgi:hypothetical protein